MVIKKDHQYYFQVQQQLFTTGRKYCDFVVCSVKDNIKLVCQRVVPDQDHWNTVVPKLTIFWRFCVLPEILGHWYTRKRDLPLQEAGSDAVCFCRNETGEAVVHCSNETCPISSYHLSCLKLNGVPNKWLCPLCHKAKGISTQRPSVVDNVTQKAVDLNTAICVCNEKAKENDRLIECHNSPCTNGIYFHLACMNYKRRPNNAQTTWICPDCVASNQQNSNKYKQNNVRSTKTENLTDNDYKLISSPTGWLNGDIILEIQKNLKKIDPTMEGLQYTLLGPVCHFKRVNGPFVQILHNGADYWVCISSVGSSNGIVNLYDSLYNNVISKELKSKLLIWLVKISFQD